MFTDALTLRRKHLIYNKEIITSGFWSNCGGEYPG